MTGWWVFFSWLAKRPFTGPLWLSLYQEAWAQGRLCIMLKLLVIFRALELSGQPRYGMCDVWSGCKARVW